jgi:hypothetical protein
MVTAVGVGVAVVVAENQATGVRCGDSVAVTVMDLDMGAGWDLRDYAAFQRCYSIGGGPPVGVCLSFDFDGDEDVDIDDYTAFAANLNGS